MDKIPNKFFHNCHSEEGIANNRNLASNHEISEMSTTVTLRNISSMLFEENNNENTNSFIDKAALKEVERSFYDILEQKHSSSRSDLQESNVPQMFHGITNQIQNESIPSLDFKRRMEEGMKFLPNIYINRSTVDLQANKTGFHSKRKNDSDLVQRMVKEGEEDRNSMMVKGKRMVKEGEEDRNSMMVKGKRHANSVDLSLVEGQKYKINVLCYKNQDDVLFDKVFLLHEEQYEKDALHLRVIMQNGTSSCSKMEIFENSIDLRTLLIHCSQAIAVNDRNTNQLIKQIKKHSSPFGDGVQRMAHIFANGLEARLNGTISELEEQLMPHRTITDFFSCFHMYLVSCPIFMASQHFFNYTILNAARKASKLHIIILVGIDFGFTTLFLIHELSKRIGGPPNLRITTIKNPASNSLSAEQIELAWKKLEVFSRRYGVPLEYRGLETEWDKICIDDLDIDKDEVVIMSCHKGFEYLQEETNVMNDPKNQVLDIIRQIRPHIFIQSIINGSHSSSFFVDRFKQVLDYTYLMFDFYDATMPHNNKQRWFLENIVWGRAMINLIACEGSERCVGAENYKQWHTRNSRAGLEQLLLDRVILKRIKDKVNEVYHKSFFIDDDKEWLLIGWKGRVMSAVSAWHSRQT
ncbi:hypothetical protein LUZ60_007141 [Juncus effusus]|nr:hypothetical protein LUZ60_007141 [Juncus effusus]